MTTPIPKTRYKVSYRDAIELNTNVHREVIKHLEASDIYCYIVESTLPHFILDIAMSFNKKPKAVLDDMISYRNSFKFQKNLIQERTER